MTLSKYFYFSKWIDDRIPNVFSLSLANFLISCSLLSNITSTEYCIFRVPKHKRKSYTPVEWNEYFENCHDVIVGENVSDDIVISTSLSRNVIELDGSFY